MGAEVAPRPATPSRTVDAAALREWAQTTSKLQAAIDREQSQNGPRSRALIDLYMSLGLTNQEHGAQALAVDAFQLALQAKRANDGLYTLDQAPMLDLLRTNEAAVGDFEAAGRLQTTLLRLARANPADPRSVAIWHESGDRELAAYERYLAGGRPGTVTVSVTGPMGGGGVAGPPDGGALMMARGSYFAAIRSLVQRGDFGTEELPALERNLLHSFYLEVERNRDRGNGDSQGTFVLGEQSYRRLAGYVALNAGTPLELAREIVGLGDWQLLFSHNGEAVERYDEAYRILVDAGEPEAVIRQLFPTDRPVLLPAFEPSPFESDEPRADAGYVDLTFEISKYGVGRRIRVADASGAEDGVEKDAVSMVARNRFRPQPTASYAREAIYRVRYHAAP